MVVALIQIESPLPSDATLAELVALYQRDAIDLASALTSALPGPTLDRLLAELLLRRAGRQLTLWNQGGAVSTRLAGEDVGRVVEEKK